MHRTAAETKTREGASTRVQWRWSSGPCALFPSGGSESMRKVVTTTFVYAGPPVKQRNGIIEGKGGGRKFAH